MTPNGKSETHLGKRATKTTQESANASLSMPSLIIMQFKNATLIKSDHLIGQSWFCFALFC